VNPALKYLGACNGCSKQPKRPRLILRDGSHGGVLFVATTTVVPVVLIASRQALTRTPSSEQLRITSASSVSLELGAYLSHYYRYVLSSAIHTLDKALLSVDLCLLSLLIIILTVCCLDNRGIIPLLPTPVYVTANTPPIVLY
jgi:hypothetical protein